MLFGERDVLLLRLLRWCRCIAPKDLTALFSEAELLNLIGTELVKVHLPSGSLLLTGKGNRLLESICTALPHTSPSYRESDIRRHVRVAQLVITAYRAGLPVFHTSLDALSASTGLFLPSLTRGRGKNPWGNTRVSAVAHLGTAACAFHSIFPGIGKMTLADELRAFTSNTANIAHTHRLVFYGDGYGALITEIETNTQPTHNRLITYGEAYHRCPLPVHLLSCDGTGAKQLAIMAVANYREKLTLAALKGKYQAPTPGLDCDAMYEGHPFVMAADMDLRRIDALCQMAADGHCKPPVLAALEEQATALLHSRYRDSGKARVFALTDGALTQALGFVPTPHNPPRTPFLTEKGEMLDAPHIRAPQSLIPAYRKR